MSERISVIIPVYNGAAYLGAAIESVLAQGWPDLEVIVVDDGSTDTSADVARGFGGPVRVIGRPHQGAAAARNAGVREARGGLLAFLDADDLWTDGRLSRQMDVLARTPGLDAVSGHIRQFHSPDLAAEERARLLGDGDIHPGQHPGAMLIRKEAFLRVGYFAEDLEIGEAMDWNARANDGGLKCGVLPEVVMLRRLHRDNSGRRNRDKRGEYLRVVRAVLRRKRAEAQTGHERPAA